jgi:hypothetical protein
MISSELMHELNELLSRETALLKNCAKQCLSEAEIEGCLEYSRRICELLLQVR